MNTPSFHRCLTSKPSRNGSHYWRLIVPMTSSLILKGCCTTQDILLWWIILVFIITIINLVSSKIYWQWNDFVVLTSNLLFPLNLFAVLKFANKHHILKDHKSFCSLAVVPRMRIKGPHDTNTEPFTEPILLLYLILYLGQNQCSKRSADFMIKRLLHIFLCHGENVNSSHKNTYSLRINCLSIWKVWKWIVLLYRIFLETVVIPSCV